MIKLNFSPKIDDYLAAYAVHYKRNWATWASLGCTILALVFHLLYILLNAPGSFLSQGLMAFIVLLFCISILVFAFVISPGKIRRLLQEDPAASAEVTVSIDHQGLHTQSPNALNEKEWKDFYQLLETNAVFMLLGREKRASFQVLPKRAFASQEDEAKFKALATEKLGKAGREPFNLRNLIIQVFLTLSFFAAVVLFLRLIGAVAF